jgi:hypothetical protein
VDLVQFHHRLRTVLDRLENHAVPIGELEQLVELFLRCVGLDVKTQPDLLEADRHSFGHAERATQITAELIGISRSRSRAPGVLACALKARSRAKRTTVLRLALPLPSASLFDPDRYSERFHAAAVAGATHRRRAEIVQAEGDAGVGVAGADAVGRIEPDPA